MNKFSPGKGDGKKFPGRGNSIYKGCCLGEFKRPRETGMVPVAPSHWQGDGRRAWGACWEADHAGPRGCSGHHCLWQWWMVWGTKQTGLWWTHFQWHELLVCQESPGQDRLWLHASLPAFRHLAGSWLCLEAVPLITSHSINSACVQNRKKVKPSSRVLFLDGFGLFIHFFHK